jgi:aminopeptidase N
MYIPVNFGLIGPNGAPSSWSSVSGGEVRDGQIIFDKDELVLTFAGLANKPVPSLFREFSAPVKIKSSLSEDDQLFLARHDSDPFNRWQSLQDVAMKLMVDAVGGTPWADKAVDGLALALKDTITSDSLDPAFKAHAISLPPENGVARAIETNIDPDRIQKVRKDLIVALVGKIGGTIEAAYTALASDAAYAPDAEQSGKRALRGGLLSLLVRGDWAKGAALAAEQYRGAANMTDRFTALSIIASAWTPDAQALLDDFRVKFTADPLVFDKWLALNAMAPDAGVVDRLAGLLAAPDFPRNNPNRLRALVGTFAINNPTQFARPDGAGFRFVTGFCRDVDSRNPQVAARVLTAFRVWKGYEAGRRGLAEAALQELQAGGALSRNTADILERTLAG